MNGKTFIYLCILFFLAISSGYFLLVDGLAIPDRIIDRSFKQYLLKASEAMEGRIVIDGGSNATHGIDAMMIERYFGMFTPNIADNGSYPLEYKILNLGNHLSNKDIVIFSLEWGQYVYDEHLPENYVASVLDEYGSNSFYYQGLPLPDKIEFVFRHLPYKLAVDSIFRLNGLSSRNQKLAASEAQSLANFYGFINKNIRGSSPKNKPDKKSGNDDTGMTCDQFLLRLAVENGFRLSDRFIGNLKLLQETAGRTGARFIFTWPVVVGKYDNECYTTAEIANNITDYAGRIREEVEKYGFEMLGDIVDSRFDSSCYLDTYYHIRHDCAVTRTERLVHQLENAGLKRKPDYSLQATKKILFTYLDNINLEQKDILLPGHPIEGKDLNRYVLFRSGWVRQGKHRIWSVGDKSGLILKKGDTTITGIRIRGKYAGGRGKTRVWVNREYLGALDLEDATLDVKEVLAEDGLFNITLMHAVPGSAPGLPGTPGNRQMKYRLVDIEFISE